MQKRKEDEIKRKQEEAKQAARDAFKHNKEAKDL